MIRERHAYLFAALLGLTVVACDKDKAQNGAEAAADTAQAAEESAPPKITVQHEEVGGEKTFEVTSGNTNATTKTFSGPNDYEANAASVHVFLSNQPLDTSFGARTMGKVHEGDGITVRFSLIGKEGTDGKDTEVAPEAGVYDAAAEKFMKVESAAVIGKKQSFLSRPLEGKVEVTSVADGKFTGTVDLSDGSASIKGDFVATVGKGE